MPPPNMQPCSITLDDKTIKFNNSTELWNWCIQNKPEWVKLPNSNYCFGIDVAESPSRGYEIGEEERYKNPISQTLDYTELVTNPDSYSSFGCVDE